MTAKNNIVGSTKKPSTRTSVAINDNPGIVISIDNVGELEILERIKSPFLEGSGQPIKIREAVAALFVLTRKNNPELRELIKNGEFDKTLDAWAESLPVNSLAGIGMKIQEAIQNALDKPVEKGRIKPLS